MKIRAKLTLGVGLLFLLIVLQAVLSVRQIYSIAGDTESILENNYNSLAYARQMLLALDAVALSADSVKSFGQILEKQKSNTTEIGERESTQDLEKHYELLKKFPARDSVHYLIRQDLSRIMDLNMQAIDRKSAKARETAKTGILWITVLGTICFLIAFTLLINFPNSISRPIRELTASIQEIAAKNYSQRVHFEGHSEFGELAKAYNTMAAKLEEYDSSNLASLLVEKKRIETLINNMHDPVIGLDEKKKILFANEQALKILGLSEKDLVGRYAQDVSLTNDLMRSLTKELTEKENTERQKNLMKIYADSKESYFEKEFIKVTITPTGEKISREIGDVIILKNVTPFKELDLAKTNFIATISHELKTPISSIKMSLQLLEDSRVGMMNEEQKHLLENIKEDAQRLLKITGELLDLAQVETGNIQLHKHPVDPKSIVDYAFNALKLQADQKQITMKAEIQPDLPKINCDLEKTAWVMVNLLSNAVRHSPEESQIGIKVALQDGSVIFSVKDSGKGIEKKYQDKVFEKFFKIPNIETGKSGTGLGLAISKDFIIAQGGNIWMDSEVGKGSEFSFSLKV